MNNEKVDGNRWRIGRWKRMIGRWKRNGENEKK